MLVVAHRGRDPLRRIALPSPATNGRAPSSADSPARPADHALDRLSSLFVLLAIWLRPPGHRIFLFAAALAVGLTPELLRW